MLRDPGETPVVSVAPRWNAARPWVQRVAGCLAALAGASTLVGWFADLPWLASWSVHGIAMFANTAVCALLCGVSLVVISSRLAMRNAAVLSLGAAVALIAAATLVEHAGRIDLGIDTLLVSRPWGQRAAAAPMRMGVPASTSFLMIGATLMLLPRPRGRAGTIASVLSIGVVAISMLSLIGYFYGAQPLYAVPNVTGIALQTAAVIFVIGVALIASIPDRGLAGLLARDDPGGSMARRLLPPLVVGSIALGWVRVYGQRAGLYDSAFGTAARTLIEIGFFVTLLWWAAGGLSGAQRAVDEAERLRIKDLQVIEGRDRLLASVTETAQVGLVIVSREHRYLYANRAYARVLGLSTHEIIGRGVADMLPAAYPEQIRPGLVKAFAGERVQYELILPPAPPRPGDAVGEQFFAVTYEPQIVGGAVQNVVVSITDISERRKIERERETLLESERAARAAAEFAGRMKDEFLSTLSHELRTPLNAILGWSQILSRTDCINDPDTLREGASVIERNARAQAQLIADLLDMSRIISGKVRLDVQRVDLSDVIRAAMEAVFLAAEAKGVHVSQKALDAPVGPVMGDPGRLQQVMWNLLSNAVKFTPRGGRVTISLARMNAHVEAAVTDTGEGIDPAFLPYVFERFRQQDASTTRNHGGLGLGLSIVKQLVELHGGRVSVQSEGANRGATFRVELPRVAAQHAIDGAPSPRHSSAETSARPRDAAGLAGLRVLVVDDQPDAVGLVRRLLEECDAQVRTATSADAALDLIRADRPDILITDIGMPDRDGYDLIRAVRAMEKQSAGPPLPAIALTAFAHAADRTRALQAGYQMHLSKPVEPAELVASIASVARRG